MLTLQNILDSDSISTLAAKINANFQTISLSNGGPQGVRGEQGIPGLPGKQGATGPSGPVGATGPSTQIIPFSTTGTLVTPGGSVLFPPPAFNDRSYEFLATGPNAWGPHGTGPTSIEVVHGQLYFDNNQLGWWKYLDYPDPTPFAEGGSATAIDGQPSEYYVESPYYSDVDGGTWTGPDWYWYPLDTSAIVAAAAGVWVTDRTNYLGLIASSAYNSPNSIADPLTQAEFDTPNARMSSKFGTVWITSYDYDGSSASSNDTGIIFEWDYLNSPRLNSGIDRSLFKMSIDGPRYFDNMKARGFRTTDSGDIIYAPYTVGGNPVPLSGPSPLSPGANQNLFVQPLYNVSIDAYSPIVFFTNRGYAGEAVDSSTTLGYYQLSPASGTAGSIKIHNFTTRDGIDDFFNLGGSLATSTNTGEMLFDVRRFMTSNQFMNMMPQDTESFTSLENDPTVAAYGPFDTRTGTTIIEWNTDYAYKVYQGYHSVFTGQMMIDGAVAGNQQTYTAYDNWVYNNRQSWYGTSIYGELPDALDGDVTNTQELVRSAGVMVRGKAGAGIIPANVSSDSVIIYTSNMPTGPTNYTTAADGNILQSLPVAYFSPLRNAGIGTVTMDKVGIFEPSARLHVHADWRPENEAQDTITNYIEALESGPYTNEDKSWLVYTAYLPRRRMKSAAFTIERANPALIYETGEGGPYDGNPLYEQPPGTFDDWYAGGVFNDVLFGAVNPPTSEPQDIGLTTSVKASTGIRYESFVYSGDSSYDYGSIYSPSPGSRFGTPVDHYNPDRNGGWYHKGAMRFGASPRGAGDVGSHASPPPEIGVDANYQSVEYQLTLSPLSVAQASTDDAAYSSISGIGMHTLYPRTRTHFFGKNGYKSFMFDEAGTPGTGDGLIGNTPASERYALASNFQISIDFIGYAYKYNAAIFDYAYDYLATIPSIGTYTPWSANAKNYPTKEATSASGPTDGTFNPTTNNSNLSITPAPGVAFYGSSAVHGGVFNAYFNPNKYIGFNLYRDLLGKGDYAGSNGEGENVTGAAAQIVNDQYASVWRTGAQGLAETGDNATGGLYRRPSDSNAGAAIMSDDDGRIGFAFIASGRDGGEEYALWEQQGIGQREIVNSVKIIFDSKGNIGIGNAPGLDENAYPSMYRDRETGYINYLGNSFAAVAANPPTATGPLSYSSNSAGEWSPGASDYFGYANGSYPGFTTAQQTSQINSQTTLPENIRLEVAAEKAQSRIGHHMESRGYGYPGFSVNNFGIPTGTGGVIVITDDAARVWANRYFAIDAAAAGIPARWSGAVHTFTFDNLGRLMSYVIDFAVGGYADGADILLTCPRNTIPHPTEFSATGLYQASYNTLANGYPYFWALPLGITRELNGSLLSPGDELWIPTSAAAGVLDTLIYDAAAQTATATFRREAFDSAVVRLNNFVLGDGYEFIRTSGESADMTAVEDLTTAATQEIYAGRTASPKLLLTFGAPDYMTMRSATADLTPSEITNLEDAGLAPLMKVTTVIDSAQTEAALRTYTIPRADNTGGTFLVATDHMGQREQDNPGLNSLYPGVPPNQVNVQRLRVDRVTAYEVQKVSEVSAQLVGAAYRFSGSSLPEQFSYEMLPIQYVKLPGSPVYPHEWGVENGIYPTNPLAAETAWAEVTRDIDLYWEVENYNGDALSNFVNEDGAGLDNNINSNLSSGIRYRRLNENYVLFDFNITLAPRTVTYNAQASPLPLSGSIGTDGAGNNYEYYVHSPYAAGTYGQSLQEMDTDGDGQVIVDGNWLGIDARWVQYIRLTYDISLDNDFIGAPGVTDPYFYEKQYGGGANFGNWSEHRAWYPGTAVVGTQYM